jgi:hypothetical protein
MASVARSSAVATGGVLPIIITILALADGVLHFGLDFILFRGNIIGGFGPRPGAGSGTAPRPATPPPGPRPPQLPVSLNELFLLSLVGYVVLLALFWLAPRWLGRWSWLVDVAMIAYAGLIFAGWLLFGHPNPMGLGYLARGVELLLAVTLVIHIIGLVGQRSSATTLGRF